MQRELTSHKVNGLNESLKISVMDKPGQGNACHKYVIRPIELDTFPAETDPKRSARLMRACCDVNFQEGPIGEYGVNGVSNEALLAIVEDRLLGFQSGPFACRENAYALKAVQDAMMWLQQRTRDRMARGVEGVNQK